ncbi:MAG: polyprenol monophosphomannose synthase [Planctomycetota bacterium]|jgi:dolichol-phosphate mannosyltransferase
MADSAGSQPAVTVVVPTYQEAGNLGTLIPAVTDAMQAEARDVRLEILVVDDDSRDGTIEVVADLGSDYPVRLITRTNERGLASAVARGFREARGDVIACMDADLSHPPESVPALVMPLVRDEADFAIGSRYVDGGSVDDRWGFLRRVNSRGATVLARPLTSARDPLAGFFALKRADFDAANRLSLIGYKICLELLVKIRPKRCVEVPIHFRDRQHGESKLTLKTQVAYLQHLGRLYAHRFVDGRRQPTR